MMWSDNETATDLLGFKVHADLIKSVVTDSALLPVVLGVFGDWGGGKSSIMKMLDQDLNSEEYKDVVCLYCPKRASAKLCTFGVRLSVATHSD